jgi:hypothetical protein
MSVTWAQPAMVTPRRKAAASAIMNLGICYVLVRMNENAMDATDWKGWPGGQLGGGSRPAPGEEEPTQYCAAGSQPWSGSAQVTDAEWRPISSI